MRLSGSGRRPAPHPKGSGVYLFKDDGGRVLYVGKAVNLKHRLASYLKTPEKHDPKTALMLKKMARVDVILTATGREALILERNLIKEHRPRYNVMLRDDKNYLCLRLDLKENFPALRFVRRFNPDGALYFGPYASGGMARETLKVMKQAFGVRTCKERRLAPRSRPCLEYQLANCLGPCAGLVTEAAYRQAVAEALLFLKGKGGNLLKRLKAQMAQAAADLDFERAAILRDRVKAITATLERQDMARPNFRDQDVLGLAEDEGQALITVLLVRAGLVTGGREYFFPELPPGGDLLGAFLKLYYTEGRPLPDELLLPAEVPDRRLLEALFTDEKGAKVALLVAPGGDRARLLALAADNARDALRRRRTPPDPGAALQDLQARLKLPQPPRPAGVPGHLHPPGGPIRGGAHGLHRRGPGQIPLPPLQDQGGGGPGRLRHAPGGGHGGTTARRARNCRTSWWWTAAGASSTWSSRPSRNWP